MELKEGMRWDYYSRSIEAVETKDAMAAIDEMINQHAREGWRLHTIQYGIVAPCEGR